MAHLVYLQRVCCKSQLGVKSPLSCHVVKANVELRMIVRDDRLALFVLLNVAC